MKFAFRKGTLAAGWNLIGGVKSKGGANGGGGLQTKENGGSTGKPVHRMKAGEDPTVTEYHGRGRSYRCCSGFQPGVCIKGVNQSFCNKA